MYCSCDGIDTEVEHSCEVRMCPNKTRMYRDFLSSFRVYLCEDHINIPLYLDGRTIVTDMEAQVKLDKELNRK